MNVKLFILATLPFIATACDKAKEPARAIPSLPGNTVGADANVQGSDGHNYEEREGVTYMYVTAVSEEDRKKGRAAGDVVMYRYLGRRDGRYVLVGVDDSGRISGRFECNDPCRIIKMNYGGAIGRMPYDTGTVLGSAFEDAIAGKLDIAENRPVVKDVGKSNVIPAAFIGEWNADTSACGTGNNDTELVVESNKVRFYESVAIVRSVRTNADGSITVKASFEGEGQAWDDSISMSVSKTGAELMMGDLTRRRCG